MASTFPRWDFHVHTHYSGCCKEDYGVLEAWDQAKTNDFDGIGISDHCNYRAYNAGFIFDQKNLVEKNGLSENVKIGLEITIVDPKGRLGVHPKYLQALDFHIISEHLHIAKLFSPFYRVKHKIKRWYADPKNYQNKLRKFHANHRALYLNGIHQHPRSILAHVFRFTRGRQIFDPVLLELGEDICEAAQTSEVAIEVHSGFLKAALADPSPHREFVLSFFRICQKYDLYYSLGSDAHNLRNVANFEDLPNALAILGVPTKRIIDPSFFKPIE